MKYIKHLNVICFSIVVSGCQGMFSDNYFKVVEYDGSGGIPAIGVDAMAGGCLIETKGQPPQNANVTYNGAKCKVVIGEPVEEVPIQQTQLRFIPNEE